MQRREFITLLGGAATAWPLAARAQQDGRVRRVGYLSLGAENDTSSHDILVLLREGLQSLGWIEGRNLRIDARFGAGDPGRTLALATELVSLSPDVIVTNFGTAARAVQERTRAIPIVFAGIGDATENGSVANLARPEGNMTGFTNLYDSIGGKWLELLKEAAPAVTRVAVLFNPEANPTPNYLRSIETAAPTLAVQIVVMRVRDTLETVRTLDAFAAMANGGLIPLPSALAVGTREIIGLAAQHRLPAIYLNRNFVINGGLMGYGAKTPDYARGVPMYVDRILHGAQVSELPVQFPTKFELVVSLKAAKAIGLTIAEAFLLRADEVIE